MDDLKLGIIIAQIINFGIIFFIFKHFLGEKIVKIIEERRESIANIANTDKEMADKLEESKKEAEKIISEARKKAVILEENAIELAKQNKQKIILEAERDAESIISTAKDNTEKDRLSMMNNMKSKIVDLSLKLNEKLFKEEKVNKDFMEKELELLK